MPWCGRSAITSGEYVNLSAVFGNRLYQEANDWLVEREGYESAEHLGAVDSEQGRDIVAWREGALWAFQCKRVRGKLEHWCRKGV